MNLSGVRSTPPPWLPPMHDRRVIDRQWMLVAVMVVCWGMLYFGYRAVVGVAVTAAVAVVAHGVVGWAREAMGFERVREARGTVLLLGVLGGAALPVAGIDVAGNLPAEAGAAWGEWWRWLVWSGFAGVVVGGAAVWVGRAHRVRVHPVAVLGVAMWLAGVMSGLGVWGGGWSVEPVEAVLRPGRTLVGDVTDVGERNRGPGAWLSWSSDGAGTDAAAHGWLEREVVRESRGWLAEPGTMRAMMGRGDLPPMEDVLIGAVPGGVGATSVVLAVGFGLYLVYRRLSSGAMLVMAGLTGVATLLVMPVRMEVGWSLVVVELMRIGPMTGVMWLAYVMLGTSLVWVVCVLSPMSMPMGRRGRVVYGTIVGAGGVALMWGTGTVWAGYVALGVAGTVARWLDEVG